MSAQIGAWRFLGGILLGLGLGAWYGFLRPLGQHHRHLADGLFVMGLLTATVYFAFALCQGDMKLGYLPGFLVGGVLWERTAGRLFRPLWRGFWNVLGKFSVFLKNIFKKIPVFGKKTFASGRKWSTIKCNKHIRPGGHPYDRSKKETPDIHKI